MIESKETKKKLSDFQRDLLLKTNVQWSETDEGVSINYDDLSLFQFVELLGAGCFTYHLEPIDVTFEDCSSMWRFKTLKNLYKKRTPS